ncbi:hypothetical protein GCM10027422_25190 [Hymenobacter arcticus]
MVTIHMGLALLIVALLLYAAHRARWPKEEVLLGTQVALETLGEQDGEIATTTGLRWLLWGTLLLTFGQIIIGTQVREEIDHIASAAGYGNRPAWVDMLGSIFETHRTLSAIVVLANVFVGYQLWQLAVPALRKLVVGIWAVLGLEMVAGITLAYFALPAFMQPIHLTLATLLFGIQFLAVLALRRLSRVSIKPVRASMVAQTTL